MSKMKEHKEELLNKALIEMVANARILAAFSDNDKVSELAEQVKYLGSLMASESGHTIGIFNAEAIDRYLELIGRK